MKEQIVMGNRVKDLVTGVEGIVTAEVKYMNGCEKWQIDLVPTDPEKYNGDVKQWWIDKQQVVKVNEGIAAQMVPVETGGPANTPPSTRSL